MKNSSNWMNVFFYWNWTYFVHIRIKLLIVKLQRMFLLVPKKWDWVFILHISINMQHWNYGENIQIWIYFEVFIVVSSNLRNHFWILIIFEKPSFSKFRLQDTILVVIVLMFYVVCHLLDTMWTKTFAYSACR